MIAVTIVHPPSTDRETNAIEHLDFAPPCNRKELDGTLCGEAATWIIWRKPKPCGCPASLVILRCDPHWERRNRVEWLICTDCGTRYPRRGADLRSERI